MTEPVLVWEDPQFGERGRLEVGVAAGDPELGDVVVLGRTRPLDGDELYAVPAGKTFVGVATVVVAVGESGRLVLVDDEGKELCGVAFDHVATELVISRSDVSLDGGRTVRVTSSGVRGHVLLRGHLRD